MIDSSETPSPRIIGHQPPSPPNLPMKLCVGLLLHDVDIQPWPGAPISAVHTNEDRDRTAEVFRQTIRVLRAEGEIN